jgi:hypothetical protein
MVIVEQAGVAPNGSRRPARREGAYALRPDTPAEEGESCGDPERRRRAGRRAVLQAEREGQGRWCCVLAPQAPAVSQDAIGGFASSQVRHSVSRVLSLERPCERS